MSEPTCCVCWDRERNRLELCTLDALLQENCNAFLDDKPARALIRTRMTEDQAKQFIKGHAALMAKRSLAKLEAEEKAGAA
jgi:hypothetical protein